MESVGCNKTLKEQKELKWEREQQLTMKEKEEKLLDLENQIWLNEEWCDWSLEMKTLSRKTLSLSLSK